MTSLSRESSRVVTQTNLLRRALVVTCVLAMAWPLVVHDDGRQQTVSRGLECGTDPLEILRIGEIVDPSTLHFIVDAHCTVASYRSDGSIGLRFRGARVDVETQKLIAGGSAYYEIVSIGRWRND